MKKIILALLALLALSIASVSLAQSSVTVYGILDVGYIGTNYNGTGSSMSSKETTNAIGQSAEQNSRLGFKGSEDLGGGTQGIFTIETGITPNSSTASTFNNRQTFVGLHQNGLGAVTIGTQYTPIFNAVGLTDPGQQNNIVGDVIYAANPQASASNPGTAPYEATSSTASTVDSLTIRTTNTLIFTSDTFNGFSGNIMTTQNSQNSNQTSSTAGGTTNYTGYGIGLNYAWHKLYLVGAYQTLKSYQSASTLSSPTPVIWNTSSGGTNMKDNQSYLAGTYDFGILKAYLQYINRKAIDTVNQNYYTSRTAQQIGVRGYLTPTIEGWASIGNGKIASFGTGQPAAGFVGFQLGSNYWLSKRTNLYAIYGQTNTFATSVTQDLTANNYAVGIRHTF